jgi:ribose transport system ATP-binding protein
MPERMEMENSANILNAENITKSFPGVLALDNVSIEVKQGEIIGIAGENGAGKSTLLNIIAGIYQPDSGQLFLRTKLYSPLNYQQANRNGVFMVFQEQGLVPSLYVYENLFLANEGSFITKGILNKKRMIKEAADAMESLNLKIDPTKLTWNYSFHERQMIEISKAFTLAKILEIEMPLILLDEPTSGLSDAEIATLFDKVKEYSERASFLFISHRLSELIELCDRLYIFKDGKNIESLSTEHTSEADIHEYMVGRKRESEFYREDLQIRSTGKEIFAVNGLMKEDAFSDVTFGLNRKEILGIGGIVGCGKTELGICLAGIEKLDRGSITIEGYDIHKVTLQNMMKRGVGYVPGDRKNEGIIGYLPVNWNVTLPSIPDIVLNGLPLLNIKRENEITRTFVSKFKIKTPRITTMCYSLSGGNQQKVLMAKWVAKNLKVIILDNPTRGIDVGAKEEIYKILRDLVEQGLSIILITDDLLELIGLSNRIVIMKDGIITNEFESPPENKTTENELVKYMV